MNNYTLPPGIVKVCAGLVQSATTEPYLSALCAAEQTLFDKYPAEQQQEARRLVAAVKVNIRHPRRPSAATLLRQFDLSVSESTFKRYKREYCYVLARESHLISDATLSSAPIMDVTNVRLLHFSTM